jgi:hypothetical protein
MYLAAEPFVRRAWPHSLISWSRLVSGRYQDPLVGRDLLIGIAVGLAVAALTIGGIAASLATRQPGLATAEIEPAILLGWQGAWSFVTYEVLGGILVGLTLLYAVTGGERILRRRWLALVVVWVVVTSIEVGPGFGAGSFWIIATVTALRVAALLLTLARFGLVAVCVAGLASDFAENAAFSFNWSLPHVAYSWPPILFLVGLALVGFWMATSGAGMASRSSH